MRNATPWGQADNATVLAEGIISYSTPSHGGIWLSSARRAAIAGLGAETYLGGLEWWEEDSDWSVPFFFFREDIRAFVTGWQREHFEDNLTAAQATIRDYHPECAQVLLSSPAVLADRKE
jgi:hypothetical protein